MSDETLYSLFTGNMGVAILILLASISLIWGQPDPDTGKNYRGIADPVSRPNYGILFHPIKTIYPASSVWTHVYKLNVPTLVNMNQLSVSRLCNSTPREAQIQPSETARKARPKDNRPLCPKGGNCKGLHHFRPRTEEQEESGPSNQTILDYKCIVMRKMMRRYEILRKSVVNRMNFVREETLELTVANSTRTRRSIEEKRVEEIALGNLLVEIDESLGNWMGASVQARRLTLMMRRSIRQWPSPKRRARNPFAWIGKNLFGLASNGDVQRIAKVVDHLQLASKTVFGTFKAFQDDTTSYMDIANKRMDGLSERITQVHERLSATAEVLTERTTANAQLIIYSAEVLGRLMDKLNIVNHEIDRFADGVKDLIRGRLSPTLIDEAELRNTIFQLQDNLRRNYNVFHLTELEPQYYYRYAKVHHFRTNDEVIYITMTFPLSSIKKMFYLYSVNVHNTPLKQRSEFTSRLRTQVDYFGITEDGRNFIELTQKELSQCEDTTAVRCTSSIKIFDAEHPTCMAAIYLDQPEKIQELCEFRFEVLAPTVEMMDEGQGKLLVSNADFAIIQCQTETPRQREGCSYCRLDFLCGCSIYIANENSNAAMPARINNCAPPATEYVLEYPVNLAVLARVFGQDGIEKIKGDDLFPREQIPGLPEIRISDDFQVNINRDYAYSMDLNEVLESAKKNKDISPIKTVPLATWSVDSADEFFTLPNVMALIAIVCSVLCMGMVIITRRSMRILKNALRAGAIMSAVERAASSDVTQSKDKMDKILQLFSEMEQEEVPEEDDSGMVCIVERVYRGQQVVIALGYLCLLAVFLTLLWRVYSRRPFTRIKMIVELGSAIRCYSVPIMRLPGAMANFHVLAAGPPRGFELGGTKLKPTLMVNWMGLTVADRLTGAHTTPPKKFRINVLTAKHLEGILNSPYSATLKFQAGREVYYVQRICRLQCNGSMCRDVFGGASSRHNLYPLLTTTIPNAPLPGDHEPGPGESDLRDDGRTPAYLGRTTDPGYLQPLTQEQGTV